MQAISNAAPRFGGIRVLSQDSFRNGIGRVHLQLTDQDAERFESVSQPGVRSDSKDRIAVVTTRNGFSWLTPDGNLTSRLSSQDQVDSLYQLLRSAPFSRIIRTVLVNALSRQADFHGLHSLQER
jgi:hypothetical protein